MAKTKATSDAPAEKPATNDDQGIVVPPAEGDRPDDPKQQVPPQVTVMQQLMARQANRPLGFINVADQDLALVLFNVPEGQPPLTKLSKDQLDGRTPQGYRWLAEAYTLRVGHVIAFTVFVDGRLEPVIIAPNGKYGPATHVYPPVTILGVAPASHAYSDVMADAIGRVISEKAKELQAAFGGKQQKGK